RRARGGLVVAGVTPASYRSAVELVLLDGEIDLGEIRAKEQRDRPVEHDAEPPVPAWHLEEVIGPPKPPGRKPGELQPQDSSHGTGVAEGRKDAEGTIDQGRWSASSDDGHHVPRQLPCLADRML